MSGSWKALTSGRLTANVPLSPSATANVRSSGVVTPNTIRPAVLLAVLNETTSEGFSRPCSGFAAPTHRTARRVARCWVSTAMTVAVRLAGTSIATFALLHSFSDQIKRRLCNGYTH